jgi:PKD repeat protein
MRRALATILAAAALSACSDRLGPGDGASPWRASAAASAGITLDQQNGTLNEQNVTTIAKGFNPTNPHLGDAVVATFFWTGPATITSVSDFITNVNRTPVGNTFHLVEQATAGGVSMATYVATNVQGFPDPNPDPSVVYGVQATLSLAAPDGGVMLAAYSGVAPAFTDAVGGHSSGSGASSSATVSDAGSISINAGALVYAATMSNGIVGRDPPAGYTRLNAMSDNSMVGEADNMLATISGTTDPQWTWGGFSQPSTWLASVVALNPAGGTTNQPPTAAFTPSCSTLTCTFTNASSDPDGSIASNSWTFGDSGTSTVQNPSHTYVAAGTYTVTLTVTDNQGATSSTSQSVNATAPNQPPTAAFTSSCSGDACNFTSTSSDPEGSISSYNWIFGDGATSTAQSPSHTYAAGGTYTATLTVADNLGATNSVSHSATVNQPPTAAFASSCSGDACSFTSTSSDPDGTVSAYNWTFGDGSTSTAQNPSHSYAAGGTYTVTLTVADNLGATNSASQSVTVNRPPVAAFSSGCTALTCSFTSTSSDPDGSIASYSWTFGDGSTSTAQNPSHSYSTGGTYTVTLTVTDNLGATNPISYTVVANTPPSVNAGPDETVPVGVLYTLNASFSDPDFGPWNYTINWGDGSYSSGSRSSPGSFSVGHTYFGILTTRTITVTVTDGRGLSGSDTKVITEIL